MKPKLLSSFLNKISQDTSKTTYLKKETLIIDDNQYRYNPTQPIGNKLKSKLEKSEQPMNTEHTKLKNWQLLTLFKKLL